MKRPNRTFKKGTLSIAGLLLLGLSGCEQAVSFSEVPVPPAPVVVITPTPTATPTTNVSVSIRTIKPALAVRGLACLMCHAQVNANIITDFGHGDSAYMGATNTNTWEGEDWYSNYLNSWQTSTINGQVIVPNTALSTTVATAAASVTSLYTLFQAPYTMTNSSWITSPSDGSASNGQTIDFPGATWNYRVNQAMTVGITPPAGQSAVVQKNTVLIRAPTTTEIQALVPAFANNPTTVAFQQVAPAGSTLPAPNLIYAGASGNRYITHPTGAGDLFLCYGDIVVNGNLFLNNVTIATDSNGCRLYVAGSVFIQGLVKYFSTNNNSNLQISSSHAILMGLGTTSTAYFTNGNGSSLVNRLQWGVGDIRNPYVRAGSDYTNAQGLYNLVYADSGVVNQVSGTLVDAADPAYTQIQNNVDVTPYNFTGMLLNAPMVQSRYLGVFQGTIISEIALFRLGQFQFEYDPVFENAPALPLITNDLLVAQ